MHHRDKMLSPEEVAKREELERDKSQSAAKEREYLERMRLEEEASGEGRVDRRLLVKLGVRPRSSGSHPGSPLSPTSPRGMDGVLGRGKSVDGRLGGEGRGSVKGKERESEGLPEVVVGGEGETTHPIIQGSHPTLRTGNEEAEKLREAEKPKEKVKEKLPDPDIQAPGPGPENAIAPEGTRDT